MWWWLLLLSRENSRQKTTGHTDQWGLRNQSPHSWVRKLENGLEASRKRKPLVLWYHIKHTLVGVGNCNVADPETTLLGVCWPLSSYTLPMVLSECTRRPLEFPSPKS